jgi:hypothetical protein
MAVLFFTATYRKAIPGGNPSRRPPSRPLLLPNPLASTLPFSSRNSAMPLCLPGRHHQWPSLVSSLSRRRRTGLLHGVCPSPLAIQRCRSASLAATTGGRPCIIAVALAPDRSPSGSSIFRGAPSVSSSRAAAHVVLRGEAQPASNTHQQRGRCRLGPYSSLILPGIFLSALLCDFFS